MASELDSYGRLIELHYGAVSAVAFAMTRDLVRTEDIAQETFVAAWQQRHVVRDLAQVRPWLCGIARNQARKALRRTRREVFTVLDQVDPSVTQLDASIDREALENVRSAVASLPAKYREPIMLFYWQDRSISQVASALRISELAAQKRLSRARAYLAEGLDEQVEQCGHLRRPANRVAAAVVAILAARHGSAHAAIHAAPHARLRSLLGPAFATVIAGVVGAALAIAFVPASRSCCEQLPPLAAVAPPSTVESPAQTLRQRELTHAVLRVQFDDQARDERINKLERQLREPHRSAQPATVAAVAVSPPEPAPEPEPRTRAAEASCDVYVCVLENFAGDCCRSLQRTLARHETGFMGQVAYDIPANVENPFFPSHDHTTGGVSKVAR